MNSDVKNVLWKSSQQQQSENINNNNEFYKKIISLLWDPSETQTFKGVQVVTITTTATATVTIEGSKTNIYSRIQERGGKNTNKENKRQPPHNIKCFALSCLNPAIVNQNKNKKKIPG